MAGASARQKSVHSWYGIKTAFLKGMAPGQAPKTKPNSMQHAVAADRLGHINRTGGMKTAGIGEAGRDPPLIETKQGDYQVPHMRKTLSTSRLSSLKGTSRTALRGWNTKSRPAASWANSSLTASRMRLLIRLRITEFPNLRGTVKPTRAASEPGKAAQMAMKNGPLIFLPRS